jgi:hypothetical protein
MKLEAGRPSRGLAESSRTTLALLLFRMTGEGRVVKRARSSVLHIYSPATHSRGTLLPNSRGTSGLTQSSTSCGSWGAE